MKCVFIVYNQANTERVEYMLDELGIRGFTFFEQVQGRGSRDGEPRRGTHRAPSDRPQARQPQPRGGRAGLRLEYRADSLIF